MDQFNQLLRQTGEYGIVYQVSVSHPIVFIEGLPTVKTQEVIKCLKQVKKAEVFLYQSGKN